jgi:hypothetical protein
MVSQRSMTKSLLLGDVGFRCDQQLVCCDRFQKWAVPR